MGKFRRFFGLEKSSNGQGNQSDVLEKDYQEENETDVLRDVFVDDRPPMEEKQKTLTSKLMKFFNTDFATLGFHEGLANHSKERMDQMVNKIRSDFRFEIDQLINDKKTESLKLGQNRIEVDGISEETVSKIDLQLKHIDEQLEDLQSQKEPSVENEGWIMKAIHEFQNGYSNGTMRFHEENKLLGSNELFN